MAIKYIYPPTGEATDKEPWFWRANYNDGTKLEQFEVSPGTAIFHRFAEVDANKLQSLTLEHNTYSPITIVFDPEAQPVHFYRHREIIEEITDNNGQKINRTSHRKIWCIGFRKGSLYWLAFVDDTGKSTFTNDRNLFLESNG